MSSNQPRYIERNKLKMHRPLFFFFDVFLTVHLSIILVINQLNAHIIVL